MPWWKTGFTVDDYFGPISVKPNLLSLLHGNDYATTEEILLSQQIADERIHVGSMIQSLK